MALEVLELRRVNEVDKYIVDKGIAIDGCIVKLFAKSKQRGLLSSQIVLDISQKSSIAVFLESKIAVFASLAKNLIS